MTVAELAFGPAGATTCRRLPLGAITGPACVVLGIAGTGLAATVIGMSILGIVVLVLSLGLLLRGISRCGRLVWGPGWDAGFWLSTTWLVLLAGAALLADLLPLGEHEDTSKTLSIAGFSGPDLLSRHPLGTNQFALDLLARSIHGARVTLLTVGVAVALGLVIGGAVGTCAGYFRGRFDRLTGLLNDVLLALPPLILLLALAAMFGPPETAPQAIVKTGIALTIVAVPSMTRLARANSLTYSSREFVTASRAMGAKPLRIILGDVAPNVLLPLISYTFIVSAMLIVAEGALSFLGLGLQPPTPTWGNMIAEGDVSVLQQHPFVPLVPGAFMFLTVLSFNKVGERARSKWDPRESRL